MQENRFETPRERQSRKFWTEFCEYLRRRGSQLQSRTSKERHFIDFRIGIRGIAVRVRQQVRAGGPHGGRGLSAALILQGPNRTAEFQLLREQQTEIENECGESLSWDVLLSENQVNFRNMDEDVTNETDWPNQHEWLATKLEKLVEVFCPRIMELRAADG